MDCQQFLQGLPPLYTDWGQPGVRPRRADFQHVLDRVRGLTSPGVLQLLNWAVQCMARGEVYCEVGCFQGATLLGALLGHPSRLAYAADNFSEFDSGGANHSQLTDNLAAFGMHTQVRFHNQDFEDFLGQLRQQERKVGVYFYDGAHDYRSQLLGLLLAVPLLAEQALLIIDDANWPAVRQATWDFLAAQPHCRLLLDLPTPENGHASFWNGLLVLGWDAHSSQPYQAQLVRRGRQPALLQSLYALQRVNLRMDGKHIHVVRPEPARR